MALGDELSLGMHYLGDEVWLGAAALLLDSDFQQAEPLVILEGAPGQGKSTIAQYICQVHRKRILDHQQGVPWALLATPHHCAFRLRWSFVTSQLGCPAAILLEQPIKLICQTHRPDR